MGESDIMERDIMERDIMQRDIMVRDITERTNVVMMIVVIMKKGVIVGNIPTHRSFQPLRMWQCNPSPNTTLAATMAKRDAGMRDVAKREKRDAGMIVVMMKRDVAKREK